MPDDHQTEAIEDRIQRVSDKSGFSFRLLMLVYQSIPRDDTPILKIEGDVKEQLTGIVKRVALNLGDDARETLAELSVCSFEDVADVLKALINDEIIVCEPNYLNKLPTRLEYWMAFTALSDPVKFQWDLRAMVTITTCCAIATAGYIKSGLAGAFYTTFAAIMIFIGMLILRYEPSRQSGVASRSNRIEKLVIAGIVIAVGLVLFLYVITGPTI